MVHGYVRRQPHPYRSLAKGVTRDRLHRLRSPDGMQCLTTDLTSTDQFNEQGPLTQRQQEVIVGVANGMTTKQIATSLGISAKTAECHRLRLMHKLNLHSTAAVVRYAVRLGLVQP